MWEQIVQCGDGRHRLNRRRGDCGFWAVPFVSGLCLRSSLRNHDAALPEAHGWFTDAKLLRELALIEIHEDSHAPNH